MRVNERARKAVIMLPILVTLLLAGVIGSLIVVQNQRQADQVSDAERIAEAYLSDVATFRGKVVDQIAAAKKTDPGDLRKVVDKAVATPPTLRDAPTYGMDHSKTYAEAVRVEEGYLEPYQRLSTMLKRADRALDFIAAAQKVLKLRATDYVGTRLITSSAPVRGSLIPAFTKARDDFDRVEVPQGQEALAATVHDAVQYVIDQATTLADRIEAGRSFSFTYNEQFQKAVDAVNGYATKVKGDVDEAITAVTAAS